MLDTREILRDKSVFLKATIYLCVYSSGIFIAGIFQTWEANKMKHHLLQKKD